MSDKESQPFVTVVCKVCDTRLDEDACDQPRESICPVCHSVIVIPAAGAAAKVGPKFQTDPNLEGYAILPQDGPDAEQRAKKAQDVILVVCPICRARLHTPPKKEAYHIKCHDCHELVRVPSRAEHRAKQKHEAIPENVEPVEPVPIGQAATSERGYSRWYLQAHSEIRREPDPEPPKSLFFSGTFAFPWESQAVSRWIYLSLGLTVVAVIGSVILSMVMSASGYSGVAIGFFALPLVWVGIWTFSYAASICMAIVIDTANGNQKVISWNDQTWRDWMMTMAYVQYLAALAALAGFCASQLTRLTGGDSQFVFSIVGATMFPFVVLSALEAGGGLSVVSANVALSLFRRPLPWLGYYVLAGTLTVAATSTWWWLLVQSQILAGCLGGSMWAAYLLIQARFLGRLAWAISRE